MAFTTKCEVCGEHINKFETLSVYQSVISGGIIECKHCKTRYKSKFKTTWCNGKVGLESIVAVCVAVLGFALYLLWQWISTPTPREISIWDKALRRDEDLMNMELLLQMSRIQDELNSIDPFWFIIFGAVIFLILFRIVMIYYIPLRKIESKDENFFDIRQKDDF